MLLLLLWKLFNVASSSYVSLAKSYLETKILQTVFSVIQCKVPVLLDSYVITFGMQMQVLEVFYRKMQKNKIK